MSFIELIKKRYSVRKYKQVPVEGEKIAQIVEAGRVAPTAANRQPQRVLVISSKDAMDKAQKGVRTFGAPLLLIICADESESWVRSYDQHNSADIDTSIVAVHMMLQATDLGLGSLWIGNFKKQIIMQEFGLPENIIPKSVLAIGYADEEPLSPDRHNKTRKQIEQTVFYNNYTK